MNNTIDFNTAKTIGTMSKKIDHIDDTVSSFFSFMHMVMQNELGNAEPYFAATSPVLDGWRQTERPNAPAAESGCFQCGNRQNKYPWV